MTLTAANHHPIIIAPAHLHDMLRIRLAQTNGAAAHTTVETLQTFLHRNTQDELTPIDCILQYREALKAFPASLYQNILLSLDFLQQCYEFIEEMKLYGIHCDTLPEGDETQTELKQIITRLFPIRTPQDEENQSWEQLAQADLSYVTIIDPLSDAADWERIQRLLRRGAKKQFFPSYEPRIHYIHAMNKRKEVEAVAQWLIQQKAAAHTVQIMVCDESYPMLIQQVFQRYHIPYTILKQTNSSIVAIRTQKLLQYILTPDMHTVIDLLETQAIKAPHQKEFIDYVTLFGKTMADRFDHIRLKGRESQLLTGVELERLRSLEEKASLCKETIQPMLEQLLQATEPKQLLLQVNELLCKNLHENHPDEVNLLSKVHELFYAFLPYFHEKADLAFLISLLALQKAQTKEKQYHGAFITTLKQPLLPDRTAVVMGASQKQYPAFSHRSGFFDEAYVAKLSNYPSLMHRHQQYMQQLEAQLFSYPNLVVSYPLGSYEGKSNESALEMEQLLQQKSVLAEPLQRCLPKQAHYEITQETAQQLYLKHGKIYGSVSSLERYMRCPFSYFLTYGLKIKQPIDYQFSQSRIGTLSHYVLETLVNRCGKAYTDAKRDEIEAIIDEALQSVSDIYVLLSDQIPALKQRLTESLLATLQDLKEGENHSSLKPFACEKEFWWDIESSDQINLCLHGFIDRIDANEHYMRIIDYKSSKKTLSETDFCAGLQLQLVAYALYAYETWNKRMLGAFYYSLKKENVAAAAGKMKRRPITYVPMDQSDWEKQRFSKQRLRGWVMHEDIQVMDDDGTHIYGVRCNKDGLLKANKTYSIEALKTMLLTMLEQIKQRILSGDIACEPSEDACLFCPYHDICRFHGYAREKELMVEFEQEEKES